jgi:hypothetical protein
MSAQLRALSNSLNACQLVKLDSRDPKSPVVVMQEGYSPTDITCRMRMYYLQRDGMWIDEIARSTRPDSEAGDVVFETGYEAMQLLSSLHGRPIIRELPVTEADTRAYLSRVQSGGSAEDLLRDFLARYRKAKDSQNPA